MAQLLQIHQQLLSFNISKRFMKSRFLRNLSTAAQPCIRHCFYLHFIIRYIKRTAHELTFMSDVSLADFGFTFQASILIMIEELYFFRRLGHTRPSETMTMLWTESCQERKL